MPHNQSTTIQSNNINTTIPSSPTLDIPKTLLPKLELAVAVLAVEVALPILLLAMVVEAVPVCHIISKSPYKFKKQQAQLPVH